MSESWNSISTRRGALWKNAVEAFWRARPARTTNLTHICFRGTKFEGGHAYLAHRPSLCCSATSYHSIPTVFFYGGLRSKAS